MMWAGRAKIVQGVAIMDDYVLIRGIEAGNVTEAHEKWSAYLDRNHKGNYHSVDVEKFEMV